MSLYCKVFSSTNYIMNYFKIAIVITLTAVLFSSCKQDKHIKGPEIFRDLIFDNVDITIPVSADTKEFTISYHRDERPTPDGELRDDAGVIVVDDSSTALMGQHFSTAAYNSQSQRIITDYNITKSTGNLTIKLMPEQIKSPLLLILNVESTDKKIIVHLVPVS